ncbi:MAG: BrnA antitoxin family protein [Caldilineaceae bacterium]
MSELTITAPSETDWQRVDAMSDDEIDTSDIPPLGEEFFKKAKVRWPKPSETIIVQVDPDVLAWFQALGNDYEQRINAALRIYVEAHKDLAPLLAKAA